MILLPAIDLRDGRCVRLRQGDFQQETTYSEDPVQVAKEWVRRGAQALHLVDLDGAKAGHPVNTSAIAAICRAVAVPCQWGGGLRTQEHIETAFKIGVQRAIVGTRAVKEPTWLQSMAELFPQQIMLGLDVKDGQVATHGWLEVHLADPMAFVKQVEPFPLAGLVFTDVSKDGMLAGPNWSALETLIQKTSLPIYASGGITTLNDVVRLGQLPLAGCIVGRALYEGTLQLEDALATIVSRCVEASADASLSIQSRCVP